MILGFLEEFYFVDCVITSIYDAQTDEEYKTGVLIGKQEALVVAEYVYRFLLDTSRKLWQDFRKKMPASGRAKWRLIPDS